MMSYRIRKTGQVVTKDLLYDLGEDQKMSEAEIALLIGISRMGLYKIRKKMDWQKLNRSDKGQPRKYGSVQEVGDARKEQNRISQSKNYNQRENHYKTVYIDGKNVGVHRHVMEQHLDRKLFPGEVVHHIDGNRSNNNISNLKLFKNNTEHMAFHAKM